MGNVLMVKVIGEGELLLILVPIVLAMSVIVFTYVPKLGFFLSMALCAFGFLFFLSVSETTPFLKRWIDDCSALETTCLMSYFSAAGIVGMVSCVVMHRFDKFTQAFYRKGVEGEKKE